MDVCFMMGLLRAADQFCVDCVKQICEKHLSGLVDVENVEGLLQEAERFQATQLRLHCEWFKRQQQFEAADDKPSRASKAAGSAPAASAAPAVSLHAADSAGAVLCTEMVDDVDMHG